MAVHPAMAEVLSSAVTDSVPSASSSSSSAAAASAAVAADDLSKRVRKPYTITKSRESWTDQEHDKFIEALQLFDRDWKKIEAFVGTKTVIQIRSHAQKYFLKVQKNGTGQHVPPPRPKRKSAQPYPQKASKSAPVMQKVPLPVSQAEPNYTVAVQPATSVASASSMSAWVHHMAPPTNLGMMKKDAKPGSVPSGHSIDQMASNGPHQVMPLSQGDRDVVLRVMPDFAEVYSFLGSVFDPTVHGHRERMDEMAPIDRETVLLLMRNLSINLSSGDFEEHKLFLSVYGMDSEAAMPPLDHNMGSKSTDPVSISQPSLETGDGSLDSGICGFLQGVDDRDEPQDIEEGKVMLESCANELAEIPLECAFGEGNVESSKADMSCEDGLQNASLLEECLLDAPGGSYSPGTEENDKSRSRDSYEGERSGGCKTEAIVDRWWS